MMAKGKEKRCRVQKFLHKALLLRRQCWLSAVFLLETKRKPNQASLVQMTWESWDPDPQRALQGSGRLAP